MAGEGAVAQDLAERDEPTTQDDPQEPDTNGAEEDTPSDTKSSIDEMDREEAAALIMKARAHWFEAEQQA